MPPTSSNQRGLGPIPHESFDIQAHLDCICRSEAFRDSVRCQEFLRHVVTLSQAGRLDDLKERIIGTALFGRSPVYSTADDSIVRVRAREVRRRLDDFYRAEGAVETLRIHLPRGSYVPELVCQPASEPAALPEEPLPAEAVAEAIQPVPAPRGRPRQLLWAIPVLIGILVAAFAWRTGIGASPAPIDMFWGPMLQNSSPIIVDLGMSTLFHVGNNQLAARLVELSAGNAAGPVMISKGDVERLDQETITPGSLRGTIEIIAFLGQRRKQFDLRLGANLTPKELSQHSIIYIGAFSNPWTLDAMRGFRFTFARTGTEDRSTNAGIIDATQPGKRWSAPLYPLPTNVDYALVTRIAEPGTRNAAIYVGGLSHYGTQAAAQFATDVQAWQALAQKLPAGWASKDLQVLLETSVVNKTPKPARVIDFHVR